MTAAVCIRCGKMKVGALTTCPRCGFIPESPEDQARSILLSDHNMDRAHLEDAGRRVAQGDSPTFDEAANAKMAAQIAELRKHPPPGRRSCLVMQCVMIGVAITLLIAVAYLLWYARRGP